RLGVLLQPPDQVWHEALGVLVGDAVEYRDEVLGPEQSIPDLSAAVCLGVDRGSDDVPAEPIEERGIERRVERSGEVPVEYADELTARPPMDVCAAEVAVNKRRLDGRQLYRGVKASSPVVAPLKRQPRNDLLAEEVGPRPAGGALIWLVEEGVK